MSGHTPWALIRRKAHERRLRRVELSPGPPAGAHVYDVDGIPVSRDDELGHSRVRSWRSLEGEPFGAQTLESEGVPVDRERFDDLRRLWQANGWKDPFA